MIESVLGVAEGVGDQSKNFSRIIGPLLIMGGIVLASPRDPIRKESMARPLI